MTLKCSRHFLPLVTVPWAASTALPRTVVHLANSGKKSTPADCWSPSAPESFRWTVCTAAEPSTRTGEPKRSKIPAAKRWTARCSPACFPSRPKSSADSERFLAVADSCTGAVAGAAAEPGSAGFHPHRGDCGFDPPDIRTMCQIEHPIHCPVTDSHWSQSAWVEDERN